MPRSRRHHPGHNHRPSVCRLHWGGDDDRRCRRRAFAGLAITAMLLAVISGCSDDSALDPGPSAPARRATTPTPTASGDLNVVSVAPAAASFSADPAVLGYIRFGEAAFDALVALDENHPALAETAVGDELAYIRNVIAELREKNQVTRGKTRWSIVEVT